MVIGFPRYQHIFTSFVLLNQARSLIGQNFVNHETIPFHFNATFLYKICKILQHRFCQTSYQDMELNEPKSLDTPRLMRHVQHI